MIPMLLLEMIVCSESEQTEGLPFVIGAENKKSYRTRTIYFLQGVTSVTSFYCLYKAI